MTNFKLLSILLGVIGLYLLFKLIFSNEAIKVSENHALLNLREYQKNSLPKQGLIPLEDFFRNSKISSFKISPDGKYLAYLKPYKNRMNIYVRRRDGSEPERRITNRTDRDISHFIWKENNTLIFMKDFGGDENYHIFRVSVKGRDERDLTPFDQVKVDIVDALDQIAEDSILIRTNQRNKKIFDIYRLNIKNGNMEMIAKNPGNFTSWMTDHNGQLRVATSIDGVKESVYYRETEKEDFQKIMTTNFKNTFSPLMFSFDNQNLYVKSNLNRDKQVIELFDPRKKKTLFILFSHPEVDVHSLSYSKKRKKLWMAFYITWKIKRHFFDSEIKQIMEDLKLKIPNKEIILTSWNRKENLFVIKAYSDRSPGLYYLYDVKDKKLEKLDNPQPWINEEDMAEMKPISYTSRDGLTIHGYLTLPKGKPGKNLSVVVHPHGGPASRNIWMYHPEVQFLASRGYAVLQINFRGSLGYGRKFWMASFKQWGKKMQDDITDGVQYLIQKNIADKNKVAIYGASYGGYAVLAGLTFTPDLYACGIDYVGVSNLLTFMKSIPPYWKHMLEMVYEEVGHPEKDKELLKSASPVFHVNKIKAPLFVIQGANDPRVNKDESDQIVSALEKRGIEVPYLVKYNEGHGFRNEENRIEVYSLMEAFLHKCLS